MTAEVTSKINSLSTGGFGLRTANGSESFRFPVPWRYHICIATSFYYFSEDLLEN